MAGLASTTAKKDTWTSTQPAQRLLSANLLYLWTGIFSELYSWLIACCFTLVDFGHPRFAQDVPPKSDMP